MHQNSVLGGLTRSNLDIQAPYQPQQQQVSLVSASTLYNVNDISSILTLANSQHLTYVTSLSSFDGFALPPQHRYVPAQHRYLPAVKQQNDMSCATQYTQLYQDHQWSHNYTLFGNNYALNETLPQQDAALLRTTKQNYLQHTYFTNNVAHGQSSTVPSPNLITEVPVKPNLLILNKLSDSSKPCSTNGDYKINHNDVSFTYFAVQTNVNSLYSGADSNTLLQSSCVTHSRSYCKYKNPFEAVPDMLQDVRPGNSLLNISKLADIKDHSEINIDTSATIKLKEKLQLFSDNQQQLSITPSTNQTPLALPVHDYLLTDNVALHPGMNQSYLGSIIYYNGNGRQTLQQNTFIPSNKTYADVVQDISLYELSSRSDKSSDSIKSEPPSVIKIKPRTHSHVSNSLMKNPVKPAFGNDPYNMNSVPLEKKKLRRGSQKEKKQNNNFAIYYNESWKLDKMYNVRKYCHATAHNS